MRYRRVRVRGIPAMQIEPEPGALLEDVCWEMRHLCQSRGYERDRQQMPRRNRIDIALVRGNFAAVKVIIETINVDFGYIATSPPCGGYFTVIAASFNGFFRTGDVLIPMAWEDVRSPLGYPIEA